jgi:hypothetical protein
MRRPRAGSFSSDVSTASDLSIDEETTERILDWDKEVEMEMAIPIRLKFSTSSFNSLWFWTL